MRLCHTSSMVRVPLASFVPRLTIKPSLPTPSVNQAGGLPSVKNGGRVTEKPEGDEGPGVGVNGGGEWPPGAVGKLDAPGAPAAYGAPAGAGIGAPPGGAGGIPGKPLGGYGGYDAPAGTGAGAPPGGAGGIPGKPLGGYEGYGAGPGAGGKPVVGGGGGPLG